MDDQSDRRYDAFISYASADRRRARAVQRFLESWVDRRTGRRLAVFLDETDLRGGRLEEELRLAAQGARTLVVCHSPAAAESRWVQREIRIFRERDAPGRMAVAIVGGTASPEAAGRELVPGAEFRVHDLRRGRLLGIFGLGVKLELLRLLAFVAEVELRALRNWHLRRTLWRAGAFVLLALLPLAALLHLPLDDWEEVELRLGRERIPAIAAEADGERLRVASRYRGAGPQGFRDYIQVVDDALGKTPRISFNEVALARRLLPLSLLPAGQRARIPAFDISAVTARKAAQTVLAAEVAAGRFVIVVPLAPTEEEVEEATDRSHDMGTPIPSVKGAIVAVAEGPQIEAEEVAGLSPVWEARDGAAGPASPARGVAVAWSPEGDLWLGMAARDAREAGGLWLRRAGSRKTEPVPGFFSVQSIALDLRGGRTQAVFVAEKHAELWDGIRLVPLPTRVVVRAAGEAAWRDAPAPPFGTRSEVEFAGHLNGARLVRVDERIYRERILPLWRFLLRR